MYWREQTLDALLDARLFSWAHVFIEDLHRIGHSRYLYFSAAVSVPYLLLQIVPILRHHAGLWVVRRGAMGTGGRAHGLAAPRLGVAAGARQYRAVSGRFHAWFSLCSEFREPWRGASLKFLFAVVTLPLLVVGFIALVASGAKMGDIQREAQAEMRARQDELAKS